MFHEANRSDGTTRLPVPLATGATPPGTAYCGRDTASTAPGARASTYYTLTFTRTGD